MTIELTRPAPTAARADYDTPALEPDDNKRASIKVWRREVAEWLRAHGIAAAGAAWDAATCGERDLTVLRRLAADSGEPGALARHWEGSVMPGALADGDMMHGYGAIVGAPLIDPESGAVWVTVRITRNTGTDHGTPTQSATLEDVELAAGVPVPVFRGRGNLEVRP